MHITLQNLGKRCCGVVLGTSLSALLAIPIPASPLVIEDGHADLRVVHDSSSPTPLTVRVYPDTASSYAPAEVILAAREEAKIALPGGTPFGNEGDPLWILPQSQNPELLYLGMSAEGLDAGFSGPVSLRLMHVSGPGDFFLWQAAQFGALNISFNTRDGITAADQLQLSVGSHDHFNWGFTTNGVYQVTLEASAAHAQYNTNLTSQPITLTFHVLPIPQPPSPFATWQLEQFGVDAPGVVKNPDADPDHDGSPNICEYAFGTNPNSAASVAWPQGSITVTESGTSLQIDSPRNAAATDLTLRISRTHSLSGGPPQTFYSAPFVHATGTASTIQVSDQIAADLNTFYYVQLELQP
jgi:surface-anchored protein